MTQIPPTSARCFINGVPDVDLPVADRAVAYGHGLFETLTLCDGELPLWHRHRHRLAGGAQRLRIRLDVDQLERLVARALASFPAAGVVRILLTAGAGPRGYRYPDSARPTYLIQYFDPPVQSAAVELQVCDHRLPDHPALAGIKHLNRLDQVLAAAELGPDCDGLLLDGGGRIVEALSSNFFVRRADQWLTPDLRRSGVAGVMRGLVLEELAPALGLSIAIADFGLDVVAGADEVFICNAVAGIVPVTGIRGLGRWPPGTGTGTAALRAELARHWPCFRA